MKVYMVRGRRKGIITSHVFKAPPSAEQMKALVPEDEGEGWPRVHEADLIGDEVPDLEARPNLIMASFTGLPELQMSATGFVK